MPQDPLPTAVGKGTTQDSTLEEQLTAVLSIDDEFTRVQALLGLAPRLTKELLDEVLNAIGLIRDESIRATALVGIVPYLDSIQVSKVYGFIAMFSAAAVRTEALGRIYAQSEPGIRQRIFNEISNYQDATLRLKGWLGMAEFLSSEQKQEAMNTTLSLTNDVERAEALITLAPHLPDVWKIKALDSARKILEPITRVQALSGLIPFLPRSERANALDEALTQARELQLPYFQARSLVELIPLVPANLKKDLISETNKVIREIEDHTGRIELVTQLAEHVEPRQRLPYLKLMALDRMQNITDEKERGEALIFLARSIFPALRVEIFELSKKIKDPRVKSRVLIQLEGLSEEEPEAEIQSEFSSEPGGSSSIEFDDFPASGGGASAGAEVITESSLTEDGAPADNETPQAPAPPESAENIEQAKPAPAKGKAPRRPRTKVDTPAAQETHEPATAEESVNVKTYLHSDRWTLDDQLNYSLYADAIAEFILHGDTKPPLAIGILAPWGQGKTTLMRLIQNQLESKTKPGDEPPAPPVAPLLKPQLTFAHLSDWLRNPTNYKVTLPKLNYPTVWFNAWKYQNTEQVWAGMAYTILSQLVEQLNDQVEREKFWLALQAQRIDLNAIRRDMHRMVFERIAPLLLICLTVGVIGLVLLIAGFVIGNNVLGGGGGAVLLVSVVLPAVQWMATRAKVNAKPLEGKFAQYVRQPTYEGKLGFFHEIETDMLRVFRLLIAEGKPVVVFIDDLDRCSPGTVAQVIEAMNLFLSADFPDCYFVVGMDAQVVAASMEVAYEKLDEKMKTVTRSYGSLGWYFMDKFIQLQFSIPNLTSDQRGIYLTKLFGQTIEQKEIPKPAELDIVQTKLEEDLNSVALKAEQLPQHAAQLSKLRVHRPQVWQRLSHKLIQTSAQQLSDDSPALQKYLRRYEPFLGSSPRGIKRFANLYRFYSLSQLSRQSQGLPACSPGALARWLVIMLRWPQVVRWIQWEGEAKLSAGLNSFHRAKDLEEQLLKTKSHAAWLTYLDKLDPNHSEWMNDKQLYEFLKTAAGTDEKLSFAVETGVW